MNYTNIIIKDNDKNEYCNVYSVLKERKELVVSFAIKNVKDVKKEIEKHIQAFERKTTVFNDEIEAWYAEKLAQELAESKTSKK